MRELATPKELLTAWLEGVRAGDLDRVTSLYHPSAVLLSTFSGRRLATPESIRDYFRGFFERISRFNRVEVRVDEESLAIDELVAPGYAMSGIYGWKFEGEEESDVITARFTFAVNLNLSAPIIHHHSSLVPQGGDPLPS